MWTPQISSHRPTVLQPSLKPQPWLALCKLDILQTRLVRAQKNIFFFFNSEKNGNAVVSRECNRLILHKTLFDVNVVQF